MSVDYYIQYPCAVRAVVSDVDLLRMEKSRHRALSILDAMRRDSATDRSKPEREWTVQVMTRGPAGVAKTTIKLDDLLQESAALAALAPHCVGCVANLQKRDFGCGGAVHYPITAHAERWLMSRLPTDPEAPAAKLLLRAIKELKTDGKAIDDARARREVYESQRAQLQSLGTSFFSKTTLSSSQILELLIGVGSLQPDHAKFVAYLLGFLRDGMIVDTSPQNTPSASDEARVAELKRMLLAAAVAGQLGVALLVDA
jgi:hypothetical protein